MQNIFSKSPQQERNAVILQIEELEKRVRELQAREEGQKIHYHIQIEQVRVEHLSLEQLQFQLERMHTEHLNGTLNFGNNFSGTCCRSAKHLSTEQKPQRERQAPHINVRSRRDVQNHEPA